MHIKKEDRVLVLSGKNSGKTGRVLAVFPKSNAVLVEHVNIIKRHTGRRRTYLQQSGIIEREAPIDASNVMVICPRCNRPARTYRKKLETGFRVRVCRKCQEVVESK